MSAPNGEDRVLQGLQKAVFSLTTSVGRFKGMVDQLGTPKDTADFRVRLCAPHQCISIIVLA
eukprot:scaffold870_cov393-Prasinococcus_capsulatus_cf.AAC.21